MLSAPAIKHQITRFSGPQKCKNWIVRLLSYHKHISQFLIIPPFSCHLSNFRSPPTPVNQISCSTDCVSLENPDEYSRIKLSKEVFFSFLLFLLSKRQRMSWGYFNKCNFMSPHVFSESSWVNLKIFFNIAVMGFQYLLLHTRDYINLFKKD